MKRAILEKKIIEHKMCVFDFLYNFCILRRTEAVIIIYSMCSGQILTKIFFCETDFRKTQISDFMKICPVGATLFHADGQPCRS